MARYHFHIFGTGPDTHDIEGHELGSQDQVREEVLRTLPAIAQFQIAEGDADQQAFTMLVTDELGRPVYTATLTFAGFWAA